ncbi:hypothetical protein M8818_001704 [Zalaria obscura]|uniref:Uncharacterized protein n=1 Tax=Zalaria obscura TaxID=2024903 RepID=A0ACC3SJJ0_9PEZI
MHPTRALLLRSVLEVERKFTPTQPLRSALDSQSLISDRMHLTFASIEYKGRSRLLDKYYDTPHSSLSRQGIWLRYRVPGFGPGRWECKVRQGGSYAKAKFEELQTKSEIEKLLKEVVAVDCSGYEQKLDKEMLRDEDTSLNLCPLGFKETMTIDCSRQSWILDNEFNLVIDLCTFGHQVGEVELTTVVETEGNDSAEHAEARKQAAQHLDRRIMAFMEKHQWAFVKDDEPVGKLSAYLKWMEDNYVSPMLEYSMRQQLICATGLRPGG